MACETDLTISLNYNVNHPGARIPAHNKLRVFICPTSEHEEANPHRPTPVNYNEPEQKGPVYNDRITYVVRVRDHAEARAFLNREAKRLGIPHNAFRELV